MTNLSSSTDGELLADCRPGQAGEAFAVFYARYERRVLAYLHRRVGNAELAADLAAETFAQALISRRRYRPRESLSAEGWLIGIAGHVLGKSIRRGRIEARARQCLGVLDIVFDDTQLEAIHGLVAEHEALLALESLPVDQRDAVRARIIDEGSYTEVAARLGCSEVVARKRVSRGLAALRNEMESTP